MIVVILLAILPVTVALATAITSIWLSCRRMRLSDWLFSIIIAVLVGWSLFVLYRIFVVGAWPTVLPHMVIGFAGLLLIIQRLARCRGTPAI